MMKKKVEAEGEKEEELFEKFMCYCENADATLGKSIDEAKTKIPQLESDIKEAEALKAQLEEEIEKHRADREAAKEAMAKTTAIREKEAAEFAKVTGEMKSNLDAMDRAIAAISKGMGARPEMGADARPDAGWGGRRAEDKARNEVMAKGTGGFLQTSAGQVLK